MADRHFGLLLLLLLLSACGGSSDQAAKNDSKQEAARPSIFALRNRARLHGQRESEEGYKEAAKLLDQILAENPNDLRALMDRLRAAIQIKSQSKQALTLLHRIDEIGVPQSQQVALAYLRGITHKRNQQFKEAWRSFEQVTRILPDHPQAHYQAGLAAEKCGKFSAAEPHFQYLLNQRQLVRPAAYRLSRVMQRLGNEKGMQDALAIFESRPNDEKPETEASIFMRPSQAPLTANEIEGPAPALRLRHEESALVSKGGAMWENLGNGNIAFIDAQGNFGIESEGKIVFAADGSRFSWQYFATGDLDNNGSNDALVVSQEGVSLVSNIETGQPSQTFVQVSGWQGDEILSGITLFDSDHDGDLDGLFLGKSSDGNLALLQLRNLGDHKFERRVLAQFPQDDDVQVNRIDGHDFDMGNDIDIAIPGVGGTTTVLMNLRDEKWQPYVLPGKKRSGTLAADFNGDGLPDILSMGITKGVSLFINKNIEKRRSLAQFQPAQELPVGPGAWSYAVAADLDNDGDLDCVLGGQGICLLRNRGRGNFDVERQDASSSIKVSFLDVVDQDHDGALEIIAVDGALGIIHRFSVAAAAIGKSVDLIPDGRKDNRDGVGALVEVFAGTTHALRMVKKRGPMHFGLGNQALDGFAIRWPQGIRQSVVGKSLTRDELGRVRVKQKQGLVASCPFLFTKGIGGWRFKSDIVGIAPLAEWLPEGTQPHLDPEEFIRLDQDDLQIVNGQVELTITEELREITYLDRVELYYFDHQPEEIILTDESTRQDAYGPLRYLTTRNAERMAPRAVHMNTLDVTDLVSTLDGRYLHAYTSGPSQLQGWGPRQEVEVELAKEARALILTGRLAWYDSTTSYSLAQSGRTWEEPRIEVKVKDGLWQTLVPSIGFPAGMDRDMVIPFPKGPLPAGTKIRLVSNQRFLWDQIGLLGRYETHEVPVEALSPLDSFALKRAPLAGARLSDRGFSMTTGDEEKHEQQYLWKAIPKDEFERPMGHRSDGGDARSLIESHDDIFCILVAADALHLSFAAEAIPKGKNRTWFLRVTGWAKESSFHNSTGRDILPLPYRSMTLYPPRVPKKN